MHRGVIRLHWDQTAALLILHQSINTPKGKPAPTLRDVHPLYDDVGDHPEVSTADLKAQLKGMASNA